MAATFSRDDYLTKDGADVCGVDDCTYSSGCDDCKFQLAATIFIAFVTTFQILWFDVIFKEGAKARQVRHAYQLMACDEWLEREGVLRATTLRKRIKSKQAQLEAVSSLTMREQGPTGLKFYVSGEFAEVGYGAGTVRSVEEGSVAHFAGVQVNDRVTSVNGNSVDGLEQKEIIEALSDAAGTTAAGVWSVERALDWDDGGDGGGAGGGDDGSTIASARPWLLEIARLVVQEVDHSVEKAQEDSTKYYGTKKEKWQQRKEKWKQRKEKWQQRKEKRVQSAEGNQPLAVLPAGAITAMRNDDKKEGDLVEVVIGQPKVVNSDGKETAGGVELIMRLPVGKDGKAGVGETNPMHTGTSAYGHEEEFDGFEQVHHINGV
jgi:hypothetical protein